MVKKQLYTDKDGQNDYIEKEILKTDHTMKDTAGDGYSDIEDPDRVRQPDYLEKYDFLDQKIFNILFEHSIKYLSNGNLFRAGYILK